MSIRPTLAELRRLRPEYTWKAERFGLGWEYHGITAAGKKVMIRAYAMLCGPLDDDFCTIWRVDEEDESSVPFVLWVGVA